MSQSLSFRVASEGGVVHTGRSSDGLSRVLVKYRTSAANSGSRDIRRKTSRSWSSLTGSDEWKSSCLFADARGLALSTNARRRRSAYDVEHARRRRGAGPRPRGPRSGRRNRRAHRQPESAGRIGRVRGVAGEKDPAGSIGRRTTLVHPVRRERDQLGPVGDCPLRTRRTRNSGHALGRRTRPAARHPPCRCSATGRGHRTRRSWR